MTKPTIDIGILLKKVQMELLTKKTPEKMLSDLAEYFQDSPRLLEIAMKSANEAIKESYGKETVHLEEMPKDAVIVTKDMIIIGTGEKYKKSVAAVTTTLKGKTSIK